MPSRRSPTAPRRLLPAILGLLALGGAPAAFAQGVAEAPAVRGKVCLVLSGGGARGIAHIGVLKVLEEMRVPVDCVVGTSAGAIIGGAFASGATPAEIERAIRGADWDRLLSDQPGRANHSVYAKELERARLGGAEIGQQGASLGLPRGVLVGQELQFYLQSLVAPAGRGSFDALPIPYRAIATDFETGAMVTLDRGDLAAAIRASMSVPGAFAPVEIDGRILVDGGLVRNVGIDVARTLGAERIIAVNVGTPLLKRSEIGSLLGAAEQTFSILTEHNVADSLATLGPRDVLISPELGAFSAADFAHGVSMIPAGERATRAVAAALEPFQVSEREYAAWRAARHVARVEPHYDHVVVDTSALKRVSPSSVEALVGRNPDPARVDATIATLLGTDDFESVVGVAEETPEGPTLVLRPVEKPWGPNYVHVGAVLSADLAGNSDFTFAADHRATWLTARGLEWRNRASIGRIDSLATELREPLDATRTFFVAPRLGVSQELRDIYLGRDPIATYRLRRLRAEVDLGARLGNFGELLAGLETGDSGFALTTGSALVPDFRARVSAWRASLTIDRLDNLDFPRDGFLIKVDSRVARRFLGGSEAYDTVSAEVEQAFGGENHSLLVDARFESALGGDLPLDEAFTLGGFQNLSGYRRDQILANRIEFLRVVYRHRLAGFPPLLPGVFGGISLEGADLKRRLNLSAPDQVFGGSLFLSADSALGPLYLGLGLASRGYTSLYLYVGRP